MDVVWVCSEVMALPGWTVILRAKWLAELECPYRVGPVSIGASSEGNRPVKSSG